MFYRMHFWARWSELVLIGWSIAFCFKPTAMKAQTGCATIPKGVISWWSGNGDAVDIIGGNNGTFSNPIFGVGEVSQAFRFDGSGDNVMIPRTPALDLGQSSGFTIEAWISPGDFSTGRPLVEWAISGTFGVHFWTFSAGALYANIFGTDGANHVIQSSAGTLVSNVFQHVAVTYDKSSGMAQLFRNGVMVQQENLGTFTPQTGGALYLGYRPTGSPYGPIPDIGLIDEVTLYNRALSTNEVLSIYSAGSAGKCIPPPAILTQPTNQIVFVGGTASFGAGATGALPLSYQWLFNGSNIVWATNAILTLTNVQTSQEGTYTVLVMNSYGSTLSANASLGVSLPLPCSVPAAGLVSWWPGNGDALDIIGGNNGTFSNPIFGGGEVSQAFRFDGSGDNVMIPRTPTLNLGQSSGFTIEAWISPGDFSTGRPLVEWAISGTFGVHFWTFSAAALYANIFGTDGANHIIQSPAGTLVSNVFQHVAVTYDKSSGMAQLYRNGVVVQQENLGIFTPQTAGDLYIGYRPAGSPYGPIPDIGLIDEVTLYDRALSTNEVQAIYSSGSSGKCNIPVAPSIVAQPANRVAYAGTNVTITLAAGGSVPLFYQWRFNGTDIIGATNGSLTLTNLLLSQAGNYAVLVTNSAGSIVSSNAILTVTTPPALVQVQSKVIDAGRIVTIPITLLANGNENAIEFSLAFNSALLGYIGASAGPGAPFGTLIANTNLTNSGKIGLALALPPGVVLNSGSQEIVDISFSASVITNNTQVCAIAFADQPFPRQLWDILINPLTATWSNGSITITPALAFEGDVFPRPNGDGAITLSDWLQMGRYVSRLDYPTNATEFQRADCAPRATLGDGVITIRDWVQTGRYAVGLDPLTPVGGPTDQVAITNAGASAERQLTIGAVTLSQGQPFTAQVMLIANGNENALGFSVSFDPALVSFRGATLGSDGNSAALYVNSTQANSGRLGFALALGAGNSFSAGNKDLVHISFQSFPTASASFSPLFIDQPVSREISDSFANALPANYASGTISIYPPPTLILGRYGSNITLAWPTWASNFLLQEAAGGLPPNAFWSNVLTSAIITNNQNIMNLPLGNGPNFYRLYQP